MKTGLLGKTLAHSFSPEIHTLFGAESYALFEQEEANLPAFFGEAPFDGLNVTIPYKEAVIPYLDGLSETAKALHSVNTIVKREDGTLFGDNTDVFGFLEMIRHAGFDPAGKKGLVLGSGGASKAVVYALLTIGAHPVVVSRSGPIRYEDLPAHADAAFLVNCTPVGMYPENGKSPVSLESLPRIEAVFDLIYNPLRTSLLLEAKALNIPAWNGLAMLVYQAAKSYEAFTGTKVESAKCEAVLKEMSERKENIVLIGMPGAGKTTIAKMLGERLNRPVFDSDEQITEITGKTPKAWIETEGEEAFREAETKVLRELGKRSGILLSTGGGVVTRPENEALLRQNGRIVFIDRKTERLSLENRPLSEDVKSLYDARIGAYLRFADDIVHNDGTIDDAVEMILNGRTEHL